MSANLNLRISNGVRGARTFACHVGTRADAWLANAREILPAPADSFCMGSHRRLPHIYPQDRWLFLTWHLHWSLPQAQYPPPHHLSAGRAFVWMDRYLDRASGGLGFFSTSPSPRSSLPLCGAAPSWVITNSARLRSWLTMYTSCCCHGSLRAGY